MIAVVETRTMINRAVGIVNGELTMKIPASNSKKPTWAFDKPSGLSAA